MKTIAGRFALAAGCVLALTAASWPTRLPAPASAPVRTYTLVDKRAPEVLESGFEGYMLSNCAYGIMRLGDNDIDPHLVVLLDDMLSSRFGEQLAGKQVTLHGFTVHLNNAENLRRMAKGVAMGAIGAMVSNAMNKGQIGCAPVDLRGGYTAGEVPSRVPPVIAAVKVEIDGTEYLGRAVVESTQETPPRARAKAEKKASWDAAVAAAVAGALASLGDRIEAGPTAEPTLPTDQDLDAASKLLPDGQ